jgi:hypothetical protein
VQLFLVFVPQFVVVAAEMLEQLDDEGAGAGRRIEDLDAPID